MLFLKIYHKKSETPEIVKVSNFPCTIGRSIKNTITVDDDSVSSEHCLIEKKDDGLYIVDHESTNGILWADQKIKVAKIDERMQIFLGDIKIILSTEEGELEKTRIIKIPVEFFQRSKDLPVWKMLALLAPLPFIMLLNSYLSEAFTKAAWKEYLLALLLMFSNIFISAAILSLISKTMNKVFNFKKFVMIGIIFSLISEIIDVITPPIFFNLELTKILSPQAPSILLLIIYGMVVTTQLFLRFSKKKTMAIYSVVVLLLYSFTLIDLDEYDSQFEMSSMITVPVRNFSNENRPLTHLYSRLEKSFKETDKLREIELKKKEELDKK